jgi:hypothetical protein
LTFVSNATKDESGVGDRGGKRGARGARGRNVRGQAAREGGERVGEGEGV